MTLSPPLSISIIGAGIGGLTAAIALRQIGFEPIVYERTPELREIGAAIALWPNATRVLKRLDVLDGLLKRTFIAPEGAFRNARGRVLKRVNAIAGDCPNVFAHRADVHAVLCEALPQHSIRLGCECTGFQLNTNRAVANFSNGSQSQISDLLIGADGLNSAIRKQILDDGPPIYRGHTCWRGVANFNAPQLSGETWGRGQRFGFIPLGRNRVGWWATANMPPNMPDSSQGRKADVIERFRNWHHPIPEILESTPEDGFLRNDICDRPPTTVAQRWSKEAVTLLGDAAHPTTPNLGQGACMAIEDALMLAICVKANESIPRALDQYEARRRDRTARVTRQSLTLGNVAQWSNPIACAARDLAAQLMPDFVMQRQFREMWMYVVECQSK